MHALLTSDPSIKLPPGKLTNNVNIYSIAVLQLSPVDAAMVNRWIEGVGMISTNIT